MADQMSLTLVFTGDRIDPGRYFFARIDNAEPATADSWWLVMVVTPDLTPQKLHDEQEKAKMKVNWNDVYPCWLMGLGRFLWIPPNRLYYPHENQIEKFRRPETRELFRNHYRLTEGEAASPSAALQYWSLPVLKDLELHNARYLASTPSTNSSPPRALPPRSESGMFFSEAGSPEPYRDFEDGDNQGRRKRPREEVTSPTSPASPMRSGLFTPSPSDETAEPPIYVKTEEEEQTFADMNGLSNNDLVTIYVGANSNEHKILRTDLIKSPVLMAWLKTDSDQPYVMHPNLTGVNNQHFASLVRFMHSGEYLPKVVEIPVSMNSRSGTPVLRKGLDKLRTPDQYSMQLVRAGHLYKLAELFMVEGFTKYIHERITEAEFCTYNNSAVLDLASIIFSRPKATGRATSENTDELEEWILTKLAWEYQTVMKKHSSQFFKVAAKTGKSKFFQRLLRRKADLVDEAGGEPDQLE